MLSLGCKTRKKGGGEGEDDTSLPPPTHTHTYTHTSTFHFFKPTKIRSLHEIDPGGDAVILLRLPWRISRTKSRGNNRNAVKIYLGYYLTIVYDTYVLYIGVFVEIIMRHALSY